MQDQKEKKLIPPIEEEIAEEALPLVKTIMSHIKEIAIVVGILVLIAASYSGYKVYTQHSINKAQKELSTILSIQDKYQKIKRLNELLKSAPSKIKQGIRLELARLYMETKQYNKALSIWDEIKKNSEDNNLKIVATLGEAETYHLKGDTRKALEILLTLKDNKEYAQIVAMEIAKLAEDIKNIKQALWAYKKLMSTIPPNDPTGMFYRYKIAELETKLKKNM